MSAFGSTATSSPASSRLASSTRPSADQASAHGLSGTDAVPVTTSSSGSTRAIVDSAEQATNTPSSPTSTLTGSLPTATDRRTDPLDTSTSYSRPERWPTTYSEAPSSDSATARGPTAGR